MLHLIGYLLSLISPMFSYILCILTIMSCNAEMSELENCIWHQVSIFIIPDREFKLKSVLSQYPPSLVFS